MLDPSIRVAFPGLVTTWEGRIPWPYKDSRKGPAGEDASLVTIGIGCLADPLSLGLACGIPADEWERVKALPGGHYAAFYRGSCALSEQQVDALAQRRLDELWALVEQRWPAAGSWPAKAQLAVCGMGWAVGVGDERPGLASSEWPRFAAALDAQDWATAAAECRITTAPNSRNDAHRALFLA